MMLCYIVQGRVQKRVWGEGMKCHQCGTVVPDSAAFCPKCGSRLPGAALSPKPETFKFSCDVCGQHISVPKAWSGRLAVCPACNQRVRIPRPDSANGPRVLPLPPPLVRPASAVPPPLFTSNGNAAAEPEKEPEPVGEEKKAAGAVPELPAELLAAGKRRNLMAGAAALCVAADKVEKIESIIEGAGIAILPRCCIEKCLQLDLVAVLPSSLPVGNITYCMIERQNENYNALFRKFRSILE